MALWAAKWNSENMLDGKHEYLMLYDAGRPMALFGTRAECRTWIKQKYGYIKNRKDLRSEPHGWRVPQPVRVAVREIQ